MPATSPGDDPRDEWPRGQPARGTHGYGGGPEGRPEPPVGYGPAQPWGYGETSEEFGSVPLRDIRPARQPASGEPHPEAQPYPGAQAYPGGQSYPGGQPYPGAQAYPGGRPYPGAEPHPEAWRNGADAPTQLTPVIKVDTGDDPGNPGEVAMSGRPEAPVSRKLSLVIAGLSAVLTFGLAVGAMIMHGWYAVLIFGVQVLFVLVWTLASRPPAPRVVAGVGLAAAAAGDLAAALVDPASLAPLAYVTAAAFVAGVIGQLTRPAGRVRVTESLGSTLAVVIGVVALATLAVLSRHPGGTQAIVACIAAAGVAVTVARLTDTVAPYPRLAPQVPRGGAGVVLGAMAGTAAAAIAGALIDGLTVGPAAAAGLVTALVAVVVDLSVGYADVGRDLAGEPPVRWLAGHLHGPLVAFALAAPAAYAASALLLLNYL